MNTVDRAVSIVPDPVSAWKPLSLGTTTIPKTSRLMRLGTNQPTSSARAPPSAPVSTPLIP